ncbi:Ig-like domain-containing protein [Cytobacillus oceanisediminis]|uniref:Ig-like domain-containing protein n=1 Tax=Cytobacillus oceanisediminis TaxID=665099 RepID=UPI001FB2DCBB|nr:Ig-like domain-containing protein [Cytobacillus oceanisediminis]UOE58090.1 Ig-like domain-containing protein [Cytobacillus oceanisediminis]
MLPYSYLVLGVNPASNEANVDLSAKVTISFAKPINTDTLNSNTIRLKKVNGDFVDYKGQYNHLAKTYQLTPSAPLEPGTEYQITVLGEQDGVAAIDGAYLPGSKTYFFTTVQNAKMSDLNNLELIQDYLFIQSKWDMPSGLMLGEEIHFEVRLSSSNNPDAFDLWPNNQVEGKTTANQFTIPYRVKENENYYVHVKGVTARGTTAWATKQIFIEPLQQNNPIDPAPTPPISNPGAEQLSIVDRYPQSGEMATPSEIIIVFNGEISSLDAVENPLYVVQAPPKDQLTIIDVRGTYSPNKALNGAVSWDPENPNVLIWTPAANVFQAGKEYTVIVNKNLTGLNLQALGYTHVFGFVATPEHFHGDMERIKEMVSAFGAELSDRFVQSLMKKYSQYACDIWYESATYDEELHQNGEAPYFIHEYVNTQVGIDALLNIASSSSLVGSESIKLSDLSVTKEGGSSSNLKSVIDQLQSQLKQWEDLIHGYRNRGYARPGSTVKGEAGSPYPEPMTRTSMKDFDA